MSKNKLRSRQKAYLSTRMRLVAGASIFVAASLLLIVVFNIGEVKDSRAFSSGDYRTVATGEWNDVATWEVFDGKEWSAAVMPPDNGNNQVLVTGGHELTLSEDMLISNITVDEDSKLTLEANTIKISKYKNKGGVICNGTLSLGMSILEGDGDFIIGPAAKLYIGSEAGIDKKGETGNIQLKGKKELSKDAVYIYNGTIPQQTGNGLPTVLRNLIIDNASGVSMDLSLLIIDKINLQNGVLNTGKFTLAIGASTVAPGEIERVNGAVCGKLKRWYGPSNVKNIVFPVSDATTTNIFSFSSDLPEYQKGMIDVIFHAGSLDNSNQNPFEARHVVIGISEKGYYTAYLSNGPDEAWLKITSTLSSNNNENKISWKIDKNKKKGVSNFSTQTSPVVKIENMQNIIFGPNPFKDTFFVRFSSDEAAIANIQLMNASGQMVYTEKMNVTEGNNQFEYKSEQGLPPGIYVLQISNQNEIHTMKLVRDK